jgi:predicted nuclease with RNAse H fold
MRTVGVDLSAAAGRTAAVEVKWHGRSATVGCPAIGLDDEALLVCLSEADWVGIDAPFGWPMEMVAAVHSYTTEGSWPFVAKLDFRLRYTDRFVHDFVLGETERKLWPLSPSSDRIALCAWRLAELRERAFARSGIRFDLVGADRVVEVYPAAALLLWGLRRSGYKGSSREKREAAKDVREALLASLEAKAPWLAWAPGAREACVEAEDALDAVLSAFVARAAANGLTIAPAQKEIARVRVEGWIHLPRCDSLAHLCELAVN